VGKLKFVDGEVSAQLNIAQGTFTVIVKYLTAESTKYTAIYLGNYALKPGSCEDVEDEAYGDVNGMPRLHRRSEASGGTACSYTPKIVDLFVTHHDVSPLFPYFPGLFMRSATIVCQCVVAVFSLGFIRSSSSSCYC
jgi:hypothetical protein